jgi:hypothetical protein
MARKPQKKELKARLDLGAIILMQTTFLCLGTLQGHVIIIKPISFVVTLTLENILTQCLQ